MLHDATAVPTPDKMWYASLHQRLTSASATRGPHIVTPLVGLIRPNFGTHGRRIKVCPCPRYRWNILVFVFHVLWWEAVRRLAGFK